MESPKLTPDSPDDARIEAWLRMNSAAEPLADVGFSARVLAALPPPPATESERRRTWLCIVGAMSGAILTAAQGSRWSEAARQFAGLTTEFRAAFTPVADPSLAVGLAFAAAALAFVYWRELRARVLN